MPNKHSSGGRWDNFKLTLLINLYSMFNIPLLAFVTPRIEEMSQQRSVVRIKLSRRSRNHLRVMYFGALAMGAELSVAARAVQEIARSKKRIDFLFKDFKAEFLRRADGHIHFVCDEADQVAQLISDSLNSSERITRTFNGKAVLASNPEEVVMTYSLSLSVRNRSFGK